MTDSRLQQLKRAWEASGSFEDEAAYLRERVRVGELSQKRLELAALCGHQAASAAGELRGPGDCELEGALALVVAQLGPEYLVHVCLPHFRQFAETTLQDTGLTLGVDMCAAAEEAIVTDSIGTWDDLSCVMRNIRLGAPPEHEVEGMFGSVFMLLSAQARQLPLLHPPHLLALGLLRHLGVVQVERAGQGPEFPFLLRRILEDPKLPEPWPTQPGDFEPFSL